MKLLKLQDNSLYPKSQLQSYTDLIEKITDKSLDNIEQEGILIFPDRLKDSEDLSKEQVLLKSINNNYLTSNIVGFIGLKDKHFIVGSRFDNDNCYFLRYLLEKVLDLPNIFNFQSNSNIGTTSLDILSFVFPFLLKKAVRKGIYKTYITNQYNNSNVKGIININTHISKNIPFIGKIAYSQREHSYDNYITQLIRHTIEFLKTKKIFTSLSVKIKEEITLIENLTTNYSLFDRSKIIFINSKKPLRHAYYNEYYILQKICLLILNYKRLDHTLGMNQLYGVLFDISWLWEEYNNKIIGDIFYHPRNKIGKDGQKLFSIKNENQSEIYKKIGLIYPDFIYFNESTNSYIIADSKYKKPSSIGNKDYLQLLAYMYRFEAKKGLYLYPHNTNDSSILSMYLNKGVSFKSNVTKREDLVLKLGLDIPTNSNSYDEFILNIHKNEKLFKERITNFIHHSNKST